MGDWGKLYASYSPALSEKMKQLLPLADVITPNLTEASHLLDIPYPGERDLSDMELEDIACALSDKGPEQVVITGISRGDDVGNYVFERGNPSMYIGCRRVGGERSGTGDVFTGILTGCLVRGDALVPTVQKAVDFIYRALAYTAEQDIPPACGIAFEQFLTGL